MQVPKKLLAAGNVLYKILYKVAYLFFGGAFPERSANGTRIRVNSSGTTYVDASELWRNIRKTRRAKAAKIEADAVDSTRRGK